MQIIMIFKLSIFQNPKKISKWIFQYGENRIEQSIVSLIIGTVGNTPNSSTNKVAF